MTKLDPATVRALADRLDKIDLGSQRSLAANIAVFNGSVQMLRELADHLTREAETRARVKLCAYRQARIWEPNADCYQAAMSVYAAAFGKPDGEPTVILPSGEEKQGWELET